MSIRVGHADTSAELLVQEVLQHIESSVPRKRSTVPEIGFFVRKKSSRIRRKYTTITECKMAMGN